MGGQPLPIAGVYVECVQILRGMRAFDSMWSIGEGCDSLSRARKPHRRNVTLLNINPLIARPSTYADSKHIISI